ncbi:photosynthetic complex assembly protein PuhC [Salinarimonas soli]|uniref:Photosynthetic complex assembly protein n=1 Tax=Salinarimonas soli TaxID=1638099 RepID=A0A5B2VG30_9HYPH|nr:photosynthetic complex assembly protein PuhC [Salinarimonas soli]KAA2238081.1 hypothetical protein F0L46_07380 [Salinarimonas soli]
MTASAHDAQLPRTMVIGAMALMAFSVAIAGLGKSGVLGTAAPDPAGVVETRAIVFVDRDDGGVAVMEPGRADAIAVLAPGTNGFVRGALRGLVRERKRRVIGAEAPFWLVRRTDGRLLLEDRATGAVVDLGAFGPSNIEPFIRMMTVERGPA